VILDEFAGEGSRDFGVGKEGDHALIVTYLVWVNHQAFFTRAFQVYARMLLEAQPMKLVNYFLLALLIFLANVQAQTSTADIFNFPELDFATPEAAIKHFANSITQNDLPGALQAFAINDYADNFDFTAYAERIAALDIYRSLAPSEHTLYKQLNRLELLSRYASSIKLFSYSFYSPEPLDGSIIPLQDELTRVSAFIDSVNPEQLANLKIERTLKFNALSERMKQNWQAQAAPVGADEATEMVVLYALDGQYFLGGFYLLRYGESWKINGLYSALAGMPVLGGVSTTTLNAFDNLVAGLKGNENWTFEEIPQ
jgi:hypothetical protein